MTHRDYNFLEMQTTCYGNGETTVSNTALAVDRPLVRAKYCYELFQPRLSIVNIIPSLTPPPDIVDLLKLLLTTRLCREIPAGIRLSLSETAVPPILLQLRFTQK